MPHHKVHITKCPDYKIETVRKAIVEAVEAIGGLPIKPGDKILLKPNLLAPRPPERAVTTHPAVVQAVAEMARDCGAKIIIGDAPGGSRNAEIFQITGMETIARYLQAETIDLNSDKTIEFSARENIYYLARTAAECDLLINLSKLKTHSLTMFTGAVKNLYGCLTGFQKGSWHRRAPKNEQFSQVVVDIFSRFTPQINIMDAVIAMEGNGPANGKPRHLGLVLASDSAPALDEIASQLIGFQSLEILTTSYAFQRGLFTSPENIILTGCPLDEICTSNFSLPQDRYLRMIPRIAHDIMGKLIWSRPEVIPDKCSECGDCAENCPADAMIFNGAPPVIDYQKCIECFCCDEICPSGAIRKKMSWLAKKLS